MVATTPSDHASRRNVLITGAARGIGFACGVRFHDAGHDVIGVDLRTPTDGAPTWASSFLEVDVSSAPDVDRLRDEVGHVDILVNSAGIVGPNCPTWEIGDAEWGHTLAVNLTGTFNTIRAFVPAMREHGWGRIVNIASIAGKEGNPNLAAYSASKAAVIALTKSVAKEVATNGVLVHSVAPAVIATPMNEGTDPDVLAYMLSRIPMGRAGTSDEVAAVVAWLASDECTFTTGACHDVSGGRATY